jgi:MFS family permease
MAVVQGPVLSRVSKFVTEPYLIVIGNLILVVNFLMFIFSDYVLLYLAAVLFALGNGLMWPSVLSILSKIADRRYQGSIQGFAGSFGSLSSIIGLIVGGILYESFGVFAFVTSAACIFIAFIVSFKMLTPSFKSSISSDHPRKKEN